MELTYDEIKPGMKVYNYDGDDLGYIIKKSTDFEDLLEYDDAGWEDFDDDDRDAVPEGYVAVKFDPPVTMPPMKSGVFSYGTDFGGVYCESDDENISADEDEMFNDVYEVTNKGKEYLTHALSGNVSFEDVVPDMTAYDEDEDEVGIVLKKSKNLEDLREYDSFGTIDEIDEDNAEQANCEGYVAVKILKKPEGTFLHGEHLVHVGNGIFLYGGDDPTAVHCKF